MYQNKQQTTVRVRIQQSQNDNCNWTYDRAFRSLEKEIQSYNHHRRLAVVCLQPTCGPGIPSTPWGPSKPDNPYKSFTKKSRNRTSIEIILRRTLSPIGPLGPEFPEGPRFPCQVPQHMTSAITQDKSIATVPRFLSLPVDQLAPFFLEYPKDIRPTSITTQERIGEKTDIVSTFSLSTRLTWDSPSTLTQYKTTVFIQTATAVDTT